MVVPSLSKPPPLAAPALPFPPFRPSIFIHKACIIQTKYFALKILICYFVEV